ncbi:Uncharacterized protein SCF082_LOCUS49695 [Durusdinium trenchii]|uniref:Uncharacterized protein n=1 Tax=Durusdinium trenchii TaxID=1381693 RepID=A0ABP0S2Z0_9DINO
MGSCKSFFKRSAQSQDGTESWAQKRAGTSPVLIKHMQVCKASDFSKAYSIAQAFPGPKNKANAPKKLMCSSCGNFIVEAPGEQKFYACRSCWKLGNALGICNTCFQDERFCLEEGNTAPIKDDFWRGRTSGSMTGSMGVEMVVPPPLVDPNPPSDDSEVELPDVELPGSVTSPQVDTKKPAGKPRRASASSSPPRRRRTSDLRGPPAVRRQSTDLDPDEISDVSPIDISRQQSRNLSSQTSMKSTQLSSQGSVSSIQTRRLSTQASMRSSPHTESPDQSPLPKPAPKPKARRMSTQGSMQSSGPAKTQSEPNLLPGCQCLRLQRPRAVTLRGRLPRRRAPGGTPRRGTWERLRRKPRPRRAHAGSPPRPPWGPNRRPAIRT